MLITLFTYKRYAFYMQVVNAHQFKIHVAYGDTDPVADPGLLTIAATESGHGSADKWLSPLSGPADPLRRVVQQQLWWLRRRRF